MLETRSVVYGNLDIPTHKHARAGNREKQNPNVCTLPLSTLFCGLFMHAQFAGGHTLETV